VVKSKLLDFSTNADYGGIPYSYFSFDLHSFVDGEAKDKLTMKH